MSHKGNDMYYERMKENADEMLTEKYYALKKIRHHNRGNCNHADLIKQVKADIKRIRKMYKDIGAI